jgi:hypothetical protein
VPCYAHCLRGLCGSTAYVCTNVVEETAAGVRLSCGDALQSAAFPLAWARLRSAASLALLGVTGKGTAIDTSDEKRAPVCFRPPVTAKGRRQPDYPAATHRQKATTRSSEETPGEWRRSGGQGRRGPGPDWAESRAAARYSDPVAGIPNNQAEPLVECPGGVYPAVGIRRRTTNKK